jgi:hypothetical protein
LHNFGGRLPAQPFFLTLSNGTWSASADVWSGLMVTENLKRDRKMHEMMRTNDFPRLQGTVVGAPVPRTGTDNASAALVLKICNTSRSLNVRVGQWRETADSIRFHAEWQISLKQYALKPPSVIGVIRVGDTVRLVADVTATKPALASPVITTPIP